MQPLTRARQLWLQLLTCSNGCLGGWCCCVAHLQQRLPLQLWMKASAEAEPEQPDRYKVHNFGLEMYWFYRWAGREGGYWCLQVRPRRAGGGGGGGVCWLRRWAGKGGGGGEGKGTRAAAGNAWLLCG